MYLIEENHYVPPQASLKNEILKVVKLRKERSNDDLGIVIGLDADQHVIISEVRPRSLAEQNGHIKTGDRILWINQVNVEELGVEKTQEKIDKVKLRLHMVTARRQEYPSLQKDKNQSTLEEAQLIPNVFESEEPEMLEVTYLCA